jgi:hypothetical protein
MEGKTMLPRIVNLVLGVWLFLSSFIWEHADPQFLNSFTSGLVLSILGMAAGERRPLARLITGQIGLWLIASTFLLPTEAATRVNHWLVGLLVMAMSVLPSLPVWGRIRTAVEART